MDVRCARCGIEYEFDDALISERGTMVRCTECGHQFRVHPSHVIPAEPDEWRVVNASGRTIIFRTLRELQQGISQGDVGRDATLLRGRNPPRPLGSIAELDPFFPTRAGIARQQNTLTGVAPPAAAPPPGAKPPPTTGKVPVARVGLSTVQVPAAPVTEEAARPLGGRKTALGIGSPAPATELPLVYPEKTQGDRAEPAKSAEDVAPAPPAPDSEKPPVHKNRIVSEPPTLRDGEAPKPRTSTAKLAASGNKPADKTGSVPPPRPTRRTKPTPAGGMNAATLVSAVVPAESATTSTPEKPFTDPPAAQRAANVATQLSAQPPTALEPTVPMSADDETSPNLRAVRRPAPDATDAAEGLFFRAESKPIESPPSSPRTPAAQSEVDANPGTYIPTVPPMRLTHSQALRPAGVPVQGARVGRWLLVILLGALIALVAMWSHYRATEAGQNASVKSAADLQRHLQSAGDALQAGDLNQAHEHLQASQSLGARDTRWQILTARYDIVRADMNWLAVRLADPSDTSRVESLKRELAENLEQSTKALRLVEHLANAENEIVAARLDAQRISGEISKAHEAAAPLEGSNLSPDLAYALASVELMQERPRYKEVFDWLGLARAKDSGLGRAPVMLVLACVAGNRLESARAEVQRLKLASRSHPLLAEIEAFVRRVADQATTAEQAAVPDAGTAAAAEVTEAEAIAEVTREGDFRLRLRRAVESLGRGELTRAEQLFRSVLAERPKDTEALTGLGDVARRRGNTTNAISYYERVLSGNSQYLPALSALADVKWKTGDKAGAAMLYHRIIDQVGESAGYGQNASQRLRELSESGNSKSSGQSESDKPSAPEPAPPAASSNIDTTDLPGKSQ